MKFYLREINQVEQSLSNARKEIDRHAAYLEQAVKERTAELRVTIGMNLNFSKPPRSWEGLAAIDSPAPPARLNESEHSTEMTLEATPQCEKFLLLEESDQ
jgi:hypothetical protein